MAFFLDRGLVVHRVVCFVWRAASSGGLRDDTAAGMVERCQSDIHSKMRKGTVKFQSQSFYFLTLASVVPRRSSPLNTLYLINLSEYSLQSALALTRFSFR